MFVIRCDGCGQEIPGGKGWELRARGRRGMPNDFCALPCITRWLERERGRDAR